MPVKKLRLENPNFVCNGKVSHYIENVWGGIDFGGKHRSYVTRPGLLHKITLREFLFVEISALVVHSYLRSQIVSEKEIGCNISNACSDRWALPLLLCLLHRNPALGITLTLWKLHLHS